MYINKYFKLFIYILLTSIFVVLFIYYYPVFFNNEVSYNSDQLIKEDKENATQIKNEVIPLLLADEVLVSQNEEIIISHIETPKPVKAIYMSSWVAGSPSFRNKLVELVDSTEINSIIIDVKDSTGKISFKIPDLLIEKEGSIENRISNIRELTNTLHKKNIYIIGRVSVFQDTYLAKARPDLAIKNLSNGLVWKDRKGMSFLDPTNKDVHKYIIAIAKGAYDLGFDEINFDYIRYPTDGNLKDINYNFKEGENRSDNIENFFKILSKEVKKDNNIPISADLFGLTTEVNNDMGIGQIWEKAYPYFDYLSPMIYPSHYPSMYGGYKNPSEYPYEVINKALLGAINKTNLIGGDINKIRPWLQDFDMGSKYTKEMIQAQIKAVYDNDLDSWMLWDPSNKYTPSALKLENNI